MLRNPPTSPLSETNRLRRRINWRQEYLHAAVILMTACWLAPWAALLLGWFVTISLPDVLGITSANLFASALLVRWMQHRRVDGNLQYTTIMVIMWIAAGMTVLLLPSLVTAYRSDTPITVNDLFFVDRHGRVPAGPITVIWVLFLWWRGYHLASTYLTIVRASFGIRLGILSFVIIALVAKKTLREDVLALVPFFFFFGLLASSLARADSLNLDRAHRGSTFRRGWFVSLISLAMVVTFGGYAVALWMVGINISQLAATITTIAGGLLTLLFIVASPILLLAQVIFNGLDSIMPDEMPGTILELGDSSKNTNDPSTGSAIIADIFSVLGNALLVIVFLFIVFSILAFIWFLLVSRTRPTGSEDDEYETLGTAEVVSNLRKTLRDSLRRLTDTLGILRQFGLGRDFFAALTIRRIYSRMEKLAAKRGFPRTLSQTPYEYRRELYQAFPQLNGDVQFITEAYIAVRYGDIPEEQSALQQVRTAWEHLQTSPDPDRA